MKSFKTIKRILEKKGSKVFGIGPDKWVFDAIKEMADKGVGALLVKEDGNTVGIISERDYARKVILMGRSSKETKIREIMTANLVCCNATQTVEECMALMTDKRVRHLPVLDKDGQVCGMISQGDLVKNMIAEQKFVIEQLENYIYG